MDQRQSLMYNPEEAATSPSIFMGTSLENIVYDTISNVCKTEITRVAGVEPLTVALGTRHGSVCIASLRSLHELGDGAEAEPNIFELKDTGVIKSIFNRVWATSSTNDVLGIACLPRRVDSVLFSLSEDEKIRVWSVRDKRLLTAVSLPTEAWEEKKKAATTVSSTLAMSMTPGKAARAAGVVLPGSVGASTSASRTIRLWSNDARSFFRVVVYSATGEESQFAIFQGKAPDDDGDIELDLSGISYLVNHRLIDFQVSEDAIWTLWKQDSHFSVKRLPLSVSKSAMEVNAWQEVVLEDVDEQVDSLYAFDTSIENYAERFLTVMFEPGRFSQRSLQRGLTNFSHLKPFAELPQSSAELRQFFLDTMESMPSFSSEELGQYGLYLHWRGLLHEITDAWLLEHSPCGIFVMPGGVVGLTNQHSSSIFVPCDPLDSLYIKTHTMSPNNVSESPSPSLLTAQGTNAVDQLLSAAHFCALRVSPEVLVRFEEKLRDRTDPITAATFLVESLTSVVNQDAPTYEFDPEQSLFDQTDPRLVRSALRNDHISQNLALLRGDHARSNRYNFVSEFVRQFRTVKDPVGATKQLLKLFDVSARSAVAAITADEILTADSHASYGETIGNIVIRGTRNSVRTRFELLRNVATTLLLVARTHPKSGLSMQQTEAMCSQIFPAISRLIREHTVMLFATTGISYTQNIGSPEHSTDSVDTIDFSQFDLEPKDDRFAPLHNITSVSATVPLLKSFFDVVRPSILKRAAAFTHHLSEIQSSLAFFRALLQPSTAHDIPFNLTLLSCLLQSQQYLTLSDFAVILDEPSATLKHLMGLAYVGLEDKEAALECFMQACLSIQARDPILDELMRGSSFASSDISFGGGPDGVILSRQLKYWRYLVKDFEDKKLPDLAVQCALAAIGQLQSLQDRDGVNPATLAMMITSLWINVFSQSLQLEDFEQAYLATINIPATGSANDQRDCLRQLLVVMAEKQAVQQLVTDFPYIGLMDEVTSILLQRARRGPALDSPNYYHVLYSVQVHRGNYRRAAQLAYECAQRILLEAHSDDYRGVQFVYSYSAMLLAALNSLRMVDPQYAWIVPELLAAPPRAPVTGGGRLAAATAFGLMRPSPKRKVDSEVELGPVDEPNSLDVQILHPEDLEKLYINAQSVAKLMRRGSTYPAPVMLRSPSDTFEQFLMLGLIDDSVTLAHRLDLDMAPVFEELARRAVVADAASARPCWSKLQNLLRTYDGPQTNFKYAIASATSILRRDSRIRLPLWLVESVLNPALGSAGTLVSEHSGAISLLRLYLEFDLVEDALKLASTLFDRAHNTLAEKGTKKQVLLPYTLVDRLIKRLDDIRAASIADRSGSSIYSQTMEHGKIALQHSMNRYAAVRAQAEAR